MRRRICLLAAVCGLMVQAEAGTQSEFSKSLQIMKSIYGEVKDMGFRPGETFIQREFFIGAPDDDDTNKDISVIVFIQTVDGTEKMAIQVTYLERTKENPKVKLAKETRSIKLAVDHGGLRLERSDYNERDLVRLAEDILKAVRDKKRLLKIKAGWTGGGLLSRPQFY